MANESENKPHPHNYTNQAPGVRVKPLEKKAALATPPPQLTAVPPGTKETPKN